MHIKDYKEIKVNSANNLENYVGKMVMKECLPDDIDQGSCEKKKTTSSLVNNAKINKKY